MRPLAYFLSHSTHTCHTTKNIRKSTTFCFLRSLVICGHSKMKGMPILCNFTLQLADFYGHCGSFKLDSQMQTFFLSCGVSISRDQLQVRSVRKRGLVFLTFFVSSERRRKSFLTLSAFEKATQESERRRRSRESEKRTIKLLAVPSFQWCDSKYIWKSVDCQRLLHSQMKLPSKVAQTFLICS